VEQIPHLRPRIVASGIAAVVGVLVVSLAPVVSDVAEYAQWFRTGPPEGVEPLFALFPALFRDLGGFPVFLGLYVALLCGTVGYALLTHSFRGVSLVDGILVVGALLYLLSPYFLFNQARLIRQSMASLVIVWFVFFNLGWLAGVVAATCLHASGLLLLVFRRKLLIAAAIAVLAAFALDSQLEAAEISRKVNFIIQVTADENALAGLSMLRYVLSGALTAALIFSRDTRIRTLGITLTVLALAAPFVTMSGIFLTRISFLVFYWAPIIVPLSLLREPGRFGVLRLGMAASILLIGAYSAVMSFVNIDTVITNRF
jgi:hypothetical protein